MRFFIITVFKIYKKISFESINENIPLKIKEKSANFEAQISKELYKDFSIFRNHLFENIIQNNDNTDKSTLLRLTQKLCDRIIFILFAEDRGLLTANTIKEIRTKKSQSWVQLKEGCNAIITGGDDCRPGAKSFANVVIRDTGLSASDILEMFDNKGL